jgi:outer membrane receptor for ferrienterochelin and colicin
MRVLFLVTVLLLITATNEPLCAQSQGSATISGFVNDSSNGERLISATIAIGNSKLGTHSNVKGYFVLQGIPVGSSVVRVSYIGYRVKEIGVTMAAGESRTLNVDLAPAALSEETVVVEGARNEEREEIKISSVNITPQEIRQMPAVGESDLFRSLQFLPGVMALSDFSSGLYIRGGTPDQNLVLLDGTVVYNPSHLFGFFSAFDPDAIKNVELIKGGFPAEYGGRLSAVLNVENKDGNRRQYEGAASIGLVSSHASVQGPLPFGSFFVSGRRTYLDLLLGITNAQNNFNNGDPLPSYYFYDFNAKVNVDLPGNDRLMFSGYLGSDILSYGSTDAFNFNYEWANRVASVHYTHVFSSNLFGTFLVSASQFKNVITGTNEGTVNTFNNEIIDYTAKGDITWYVSTQHLIKAGAYGTSYKFYLQNTVGTDSARVSISKTPAMYGAYVQDDWKFAEGWTMQTGLRTDAMDIVGKATWDPRLALRYIINNDVSAKVSWGIYHQYLHLAAPPTQPFFDIWLPSDNTLQASTAVQYVAGVETHPRDGYNFNVDLYYKSLTDITEFKSTTARGFNVGDAFYAGNGRAYGAELFLEKKVGDLTGWIGYTLSWVWETFADLNNGVEFAPQNDRRHDVNIVVSYKINDRWRVGATWTYGTGQAYTAIIARYETDPPGYQGNTFRYPGPTGALRLAPYHRMDLSGTYSFKMWGYPAEFSMQIFNVYNRRNEHQISYDTRVNPATKTVVYLLPFLPTVTLGVTF